MQKYIIIHKKQYKYIKRHKKEGKSLNFPFKASFHPHPFEASLYLNLPFQGAYPDLTRHNMEDFNPFKAGTLSDLMEPHGLHTLYKVNLLGLK